MNFTSATALLGRTVSDVHGTPVGHVEDLLIDRETGSIAYVCCLLTDDGDGRVTVTVPRSAVRLAHDIRDAVHILVHEDALRRLAATDNT